MSDFNYQPLSGATRKITPRARSAKFGDGYEQRTGDGINTQKQVWDLSFQSDKPTIDAIEAFFQSKNGVSSFTWTPKGFAEIRVICREWSRTIQYEKSGAITCTFEQVFGE